MTKCRTELVQALSSPLLESMRAWKDRMGPLAAAAGDDKAIALSVEGPIEVHRALSARLKVAIAASLELQAQEQSLAASLAALRPQLAAPGG